MLTNEELTRIYNEANGIDGKNPPITTERIFAAMRLARQKAWKEAERIAGDNYGWVDGVYFDSLGDAIRQAAGGE